MEIAPLIHSRTFYCDFNQNFSVRPNDLNVQWAMNKILPAMRDVDILNGVRRVVATDGKLCIAGVACNFRYFVEKFLSADERTEAANYLQDERGRDVKIFLGYVVKGSGVPDVSDSKLWQMFKQTVATVWERNPVETVIVPYESCGTKSVASKPLDKEFYPANERDDRELFEQCLAARKDFCSNVDAVKIFEDGKYDIITATQSVINRIQAPAQKKKSTSALEQPRPSYGAATTFSSPTTSPKPANFSNSGRQGLLTDNRRDSRRDSSNSNFSYAVKPSKAFASLEDLLEDIKDKYSGAVFAGARDGNYRVKSVGEGTPESILERLTASKKTKLIYLILEETNG